MLITSDFSSLSVGSRATLTDKFGYVSLSLLSVIRQDTGTYTCRAVNQAGSADTTCTVSVGRKYLQIRTIGYAFIRAECSVLRGYAVPALIDGARADKYIYIYYI